MQAAQHQEASAKLRQAQAQLADQEAALRRPEEIAVLQAQETRARAQLDLSKGEFERQRTLFLRGYSAQARLDQAQAAFERDEAALQEVLRQIEASRIAGRSAEIVAARAAVQAAEAAVNQAGTHLARRRVGAPQDAQVQDVYFRPGEVVNAGQPVLALLPSDGRRLRFYVPETKLATLALGQTVGFGCDGCPDGLRARITFIAREAEFTPPVIFSEPERAKLVFRAEATPEGGLDLPLGLPVTVAPGAPGS
jgi:HlyD family secretion protein